MVSSFQFSNPSLLKLSFALNNGFNLLKILLKSCFFEKRLPIFKQRGIM